MKKKEKERTRWCGREAGGQAMMQRKENARWNLATWLFIGPVSTQTGESPCSRRR